MELFLLLNDALGTITLKLFNNACVMYVRLLQLDPKNVCFSPPTALSFCSVSLILLYECTFKCIFYFIYSERDDFGDTIIVYQELFMGVILHVKSGGRPFGL